MLVVGVDSLLTSLARCCRPAPPDLITGYVTRGKGVAIHRVDCANLRQMAQAAPERVIAVAWGEPAPDRAGKGALYPVDLVVEATDRPGLLRDVLELFAKDKLHVISVNQQSGKGKPARSDLSRMNFTVEVSDAQRLQGTLVALSQVNGVRSARRR